ncbi:MAG TPA: uracil-DNA glycosylase family protein [Gemmatimonadaceae bacterium]|nr:uracil-DNA glycosylase family protein [Gemmatimonadaceae bacterium]
MSPRPLPQLNALLEAHRDALAACRRCGHEGVLPIVSVARAPRVMLVGQAPGKTETVDQRPFAGRAGKTLFRWLARAGIDEGMVRERMYIGAVTRCYPGPSPSGRGDRVPSPRERELCASWMEDELRLIRPRIILPVGRLAIDRFVGTLPLDAVIGRVIPVRHGGGESLAVPLPHPSGASSWVHEPAHRALLERGLDLLREALVEAGVVSAEESAAARALALGAAADVPAGRPRARSSRSAA